MIYGFDRLTIWFDVGQPPLPISELRRHCTDVRLNYGQMPFNARWKSCISLSQPELRALRLLVDALGGTVAAHVGYAEIAADMPCADAEQAQALQVRLLGALRIPYGRDAVICEHGTWYVDRRTHSLNSRRQPDRRAAHVRVIYADQPSKLNDARPLDGDPLVVHVEWRASGAKALERLGIGSIGDLQHFDHAEFWHRAVQLFALPGPTDLGRILADCADADSDVSGTALRSRATRWRDAASVDGVFVLHNALRHTPNVARRLKRVDWDTWWREMWQPMSG